MFLYSDIKNHKTYLEMWGASTKHPDCRFCFDDFKMPECWDKPDIDRNNPIFVYQWMIQCAADMLWWFSTYEISRKANEWYANYSHKIE